MKYCQNCGRLFKNDIKECVHDGTILTDIIEAFSTHKKPDPFTGMDDLPAIDQAVPPHDDWPTWRAQNLRRFPPTEEPKRETKTEQRRQLTSMGIVFGVIGFLLHALTALPAAQADPSVRVGAATFEETTPTVSSSTVVITTKSGTVVQKMSSMSPQEQWSGRRPPVATSLPGGLDTKVARIDASGLSKFSTPTAR